MAFTKTMAAVTSVRVIAFRRSNPFLVWIRIGEGGLGGPVGGKQIPGKTLLDTMRMEWDEETECTKARGFFDPWFEQIGLLEMPDRTVEYDLERYLRLGFELPPNCDTAHQIALWNPLAVLFSCAMPDGDVPTSAEGRTLEFFNSDTDDFSRIKARYRGVYRAWRDKWRTPSKPFPSYMLYRRNGD